jgi:hypothetical protein
MIPKIISIDFDGTIVENAYPDIGTLKKGAKEVINRLCDEGFVILINTCRTAMYEAGVYRFMAENDIKYHFINCNLPSQIEYFGMDCRKLSADIYIDDKQLGGIPDDWEVIYELIHKQIKL